MSRSYRHTPIFTQSANVHKKAKRLANKRVRRAGLDMSQGNAYRKVSESWDICDYRVRRTLKWFIWAWDDDARIGYADYKKRMSK